MKGIGLGQAKDNSHFATKLAMRTEFIRACGLREIGVLDLCAGGGYIWRALRNELKITAYLPCDRQPRFEGTIRGEAAHLAATLDLRPYNVIDIDTYGEPWEPYLTILGRLESPAVIFLTHGRTGLSIAPSKVIKRAGGLPEDWPIPTSGTLVDYLSEHALSRTHESATVLRAARFVASRVKYYALHVAPRSRAKLRRTSRTSDRRAPQRTAPPGDAADSAPS